MYIKSHNFSNSKLRIFNRWIYEYILRVEKEEIKLHLTIEKVKNKVSRPYNKALVKASLLNELNFRIKRNTSNTANLYSNQREEFIRRYNLRNVCEGCNREPIQENAHIIMNSKIEKIAMLKRFSWYCANILHLCGTCHKIIDGKGNRPSKRRELLTINNIKKREKVNKLIYENLKKDRDILSKNRQKLERISKLPRDKAAREIMKIISTSGS